ncbi:MAG: redoxin domain-containing protein [Gemmatimonadota bacterium]
MTRSFPLRLGWLLLAGLLPAALAAQDRTPTVRLALEDFPKVGRAAPVMVLPYATASGSGPSDQPFDLAMELGNVVVIAFYPGDFTAGCTAQWRAFAARAGSSLAGVVVVGVSADSLASHQRFAQELALPFKLLSDPDHAVARRWAAMDGPRPRRVVVVVGRDGRVRFIDPAFAEVDPESYARLAAAVVAAKEKP